MVRLMGMTSWPHSTVTRCLFEKLGQLVAVWRFGHTIVEARGNNGNLDFAFFSLSSWTAPNITLASGSILSVMILAASLISAIAKSAPPETLNNTPLAPLIETSSKGELMAILAA